MRPLAIFVVVAMVPLPLHAGKAPPVSWGKPGVSLTDYRSDAITCGREAYFTDISQEQPTKNLVVASRRIDGLLEDTALVGQSGDIEGAARVAGVSQHEIDNARFDTQVKLLRGVLDDKLAHCLSGRGYRRFALTERQQHRLARLAIGSPARHAYLHSLATDPDVVAKQAISG